MMKLSDWVGLSEKLDDRGTFIGAKYGEAFFASCANPRMIKDVKISFNIKKIYGSVIGGLSCPSVVIGHPESCFINILTTLDSS